ncbi:D-amino-acid oxidase [Penicillium capsulatum]|uniref:D-amino-acid oxidase n=1 Tax=Penicillium capsulatum TaxID=69766 RepID=A0A9W9LLH9_9EURO|nr:D-amino-acid oxidase [Penicillium capsulatum]KAJ6116643.1 D-amino-acid oxidase [Penicillium capsulatum]
MASHNIVVVGASAGVAGLTTAWILSQDSSKVVTVIAKHMPGDYDIEYASPWAGANFMPVGAENTRLAKWEQETWPPLRDLAEHYPEAGIHFQDTLIYNRQKDRGSATGSWFESLTKPNAWYKNMMPNFRSIASYKLPPGIDNAQAFTSVCINTALYLPWLVSQCLKNGVVFKRGVLRHIKDAVGFHHSGNHADAIINCTGLSSKYLGGVDDSKLHPVRGQIVVVRNDPGQMMATSGCDDGDDETLYIMTRAAGGGTIIGGTYQKDDANPLPDPNTATRIMKRAVELSPKLVQKGQGIEGLDVIRHAVGLRPLRDGGPRVEADRVGDLTIVHNYGHGGYGYQVSFGCANDTIALMNGALRGHVAKSKL